MNNPFLTASSHDAPKPRALPSEVFLRGVAIAVATALAGGALHRVAPFLHANIVGFVAAFLIVATFFVKSLNIHYEV